MSLIRKTPITQSEFLEMYDLENKKGIYLPGPILHSDDFGEGWRNEIMERYADSFEWLNPLDFFEIRESDFVRIPEAMLEDYEPSSNELVITDEAIVETDKLAIDLSEGLLLGYSEIIPSWGTPQEQIYPWTRKGTPRPEMPITVWHGELDWLACSPWLRYHSTHHSDDLDECVRYLETTLKFPKEIV